MDSRGLFVRHIQQAVAAYEGGVERGVSNSWNATVSSLMKSCQGQVFKNNTPRRHAFYHLSPSPSNDPLFSPQSVRHTHANITTEPWHITFPFARIS